MERASADLLSGLLKTVSRSFYLTLRVLPAAIRPRIGLAYLLARASDTIADTDAVPKEQRLELLSAFRERVFGNIRRPLGLDTVAGHQSSPAERALLQRTEEALALLDRCADADRQRIRQVLDVILSGQALDVQRFALADAAQPGALETDEQLDDYTYRVAGVVGEFWTRMCRAHLFPKAALDDDLLIANGIRFGKGLQMVNILRDLPRDLRLGRCYLPRERLATLELAPVDLLEPANEARLRPLYQAYLQLAEEHLWAGWTYTNYLPFRSLRVRLACAWPILIGMQTLRKLGTGRILDPDGRIKISRREVRTVLVRSVVWYPWPRRWQRMLTADKIH
jgi:farnesyl-diphosphate farnesyltransferase